MYEASSSTRNAPPCASSLGNLCLIPNAVLRSNAMRKFASHLRPSVSKSLGTPFSENAYSSFPFEVGRIPNSYTSHDENEPVILFAQPENMHPAAEPRIRAVMPT